MRPFPAPVFGTIVTGAGSAFGGSIRALRRGHDWLGETIAAERDRWFPWTVVAFAAGSLVYFGLKFEPSLILAALVACCGCAFGYLSARSWSLGLRFLLVLVAASCLGFACAKWRTERVEAPVIERDIGPVRVEGRIRSVLGEDAANARILIEPARIGRESDDLPTLLRLTLRGETAVATVAPGRRVSLLALLRPPPEPALPGGYDFARWAFFSGIGGVGFVLGTPEPLEADSRPKLWQMMGEAIERFRRAISARIQTAVPGPNGAISAALITGERASISEEDNNAYRDSGLFHVLSISGVHMALAGLGIFWIVRALLALYPYLALHYPIKKWSALAAVAAATFYVFISGASAPAVRSYIMLLVMLMGVLADRPALSMRSVAISAILLLVFEPEGVIEPSFQMSFSAIIGLIALAEWQKDVRAWNAAAELRRGGVLGWLMRYLGGLILASTIAGFATAPFAIYHFDRAPGYSLLANLLASPVVGAVIMPSACLSVFLMPFGLEHYPLQIMGWGVSVMTAIAYWVAGLPGAVNLVAAKSELVLILIIAGGLWMGLWQRRWRWFGGVAVLLGLLLAFMERAPDIVIARDASAMAVRGSDGRYVLLGAPDDYTAEQWLLRDGDARSVDAAREGAQCDPWGCTAKARGGRLVALALRPGALADDCARANIIVSAVPIRTDCSRASHTVDRFDVYWGGAISLFVDEAGVREITASSRRGERPWTSGSR